MNTSDVVADNVIGVSVKADTKEELLGGILNWFENAGVFTMNIDVSKPLPKKLWAIRIEYQGDFYGVKLNVK